LPIRIGVFGHTGNENLGDESITTAVIQNIRRRFEGADIVVFSIVPSDTCKRHDLPAFPLRRGAASKSAAAKPVAAKSASNPANGGLRARLKNLPGAVATVRLLRDVVRAPGRAFAETRFLLSSRRHLEALDLLIVAGSNQFLDRFGGPFAFPYTVVKWTALARSCGVPVVFMSVGAGPINSRLSTTQIRTALRMAEFISYRDAASHALVENASHQLGGTVCVDLAHDVQWTPDTTVAFSKPVDVTRPSVGINPMPVYDRRYWDLPDDDKYNAYVGKMARFASRLVVEGYPIFFWTTQTKDQDVARDVVAAMTPDAKSLLDLNRVFAFPTTVSQLMTAISSGDLLVATRFHGAVLSIVAGRPVIAVCYYRKARDLLKAVGQARFAIMLDDLDEDDLYARFRELEADRARIAEELTDHNAAYCRTLKDQYDRVFSLTGLSSHQP
jgi:polysaccharide pyruvyl transferase WcaK-like protein